MGATGQVSLDANGDRSALGTPFVVRNIQLGPDGTPVFVRTGTVVQTDRSLASARVTIGPNGIVFSGGMSTAPPAQDPMVLYQPSIALLATLGTLAALGILLAGCLGLLFFRWRTQLVLKTASPPFMYLLVAGAVLLYAGVFALLPNPSTAACTANVWLTLLGFFLAFSAVFMKTYRIHVIFNTKSRVKRNAIDDRRLLLLVAAIMLAVIAYVATWTGVDAPHPALTIDPENDVLMARCHRDWWNYAALIGMSTASLPVWFGHTYSNHPSPLTAAELFFVLWGVVLCIRTHRVPLFFNESRWIALSVYNWLIVFGTAEALLITLPQLNPAAAIAIQGGAVLIAVTTMLLLFFVPELLIVHRGDGNKREYASTQLPGQSGGLASHGGLDNEGFTPEDWRREVERLMQENAALHTRLKTIGNVHVKACLPSPPPPPAVCSLTPFLSPPLPCGLPLKPPHPLHRVMRRMPQRPLPYSIWWPT